MNIDPLAESYYGINPYAYVFNNPAQLFDPDGRKVEYVRNEGQSRKEFRQFRREFKRRNRQLGRESRTHKANFKQLKKSENTHFISFNRGKGSEVNPVSNKINREKGNDTTIDIDLDQESDGNQGNEFVIAHETKHAVEHDSGTSFPLEDLGIDPLFANVKDLMSKSRELHNENLKIEEEKAGHTENIVRGEVSNSRNTKIPLRSTVKYGTIDPQTGLEGKKAKVIRKNYDYYKKDKD